MELSGKQISDLPIEMKVYILTKLDGKSLIAMRAVNKEWKSILDNPNVDILKKWRDVCLSEIDDDSLRSVMVKLDPKYFISLNLNLWKIAFKSWFQWSCIPRWLFELSEVYSVTNCEITCITSSGDWLIISTRNYGSVLVLNYKSKGTKLLYTGGNVMDVRPYCVSGDEPLLPGLAHDKMILEFENLRRADLDLHTLEIKYCEELTGQKQIHHFESKEIKIEVNIDRSTISLYGIPGKKEQTFELCHEWSVLHCWPNRNLIHCRKKGYYLVTDDELIPDDSHPFCFLNHLHQGERPLQFYYGGSVILSVNNKQYINHEMIVRVLSSERSYKPFVEFSNHITSILYYGRMLFLGTDVGSLRIYRTKSLQDLLDLDLGAPCAEFDFCNDPIISITVKETNDKPIIWTASYYQVFQIIFQ